MYKFFAEKRHLFSYVPDKYGTEVDLKGFIADSERLVIRKLYCKFSMIMHTEVIKLDWLTGIFVYFSFEFYVAKKKRKKMLKR